MASEFATPPAFRWVHFRYAVSKDLHVFMEKPLTVDGPTSRRILELGKQAARARLTGEPSDLARALDAHRDHPRRVSR